MAISIATFIGCSSPNEEITATSRQEQTEDPAVKSISLELKEHEDLSAEKRIELYKKLKAKQPDGYNFNDENELNRYGYELLWDNKTEDAIAILELNKAEFPTSSNVYDSMGDAYFAAEELDSALANYRRSLKLDPFNYNAIDQVLLIDNIKSTGNFDLLKNPELVIRHVDHSYDLVMPAQEYKDDLAQLADVLLAVHPAATKFSSKEEILAIVAAKQALITDSTIYAEFLWHCQEIIASIGCSHTSSGSFYQTSAFVPLDRRFPVQTRWVKNELYIVDDLKNENDIVVGSQIESINGVEVSEIMDDIYNHIITQAGIESTKNRFFNTWSSTLLAFSLGMPKSYQLQLKNHDGIYSLNNPKRFGPFSDPTIELCQNDLCLEIIDTTTARLTVSSFVYY
ncbi:MAG: tetratricopeptide repeat protein, partial [Schleiferiaceae bacterium]|nr:tetratricopeptide repeat protein [Schleiferiaceae bacterium]